MARLSNRNRTADVPEMGNAVRGGKFSRSV
jgi:hypothetical protein